MNIQFGTKKRTLGKGWKNMPYEVISGYYFICNDKHGAECRYWMGETFEEAFENFDKMGDKYLGEYNKYNYWIDYCFGYDVDRRLSFSNLDHSDRFVDYGTY